jgi:hypothetical protein
MTVDIQRAKEINDACVKVGMAFEGVGTSTAEEAKVVRGYSLADMLQASAILSGHKEPSEAGGFSGQVRFSDAQIAQLYLRLHSTANCLIEELELLCRVADEKAGQPDATHMISLDQHKNYSMMKISNSGEDQALVVYANGFPSFYGAFLAEFPMGK